MVNFAFLIDISVQSPLTGYIKHNEVYNIRGGIIDVLDYVCAILCHTIIDLDILPSNPFTSCLKLTRDLLCNAGSPLRWVFASRNDTSPTYSLLLVLLIATLEAPKRGARANLLPQDPSLDPPRQNSEALVAHESALRDRKNVVQLLERSLLSVQAVSNVCS